MSNPSTPFPWKGDARRAGVGRRRKRAKPTSGATRHLLPEEGGRSGMSNPSTPFPWKGDARRAGVGRRRKRAKPTSGATRHLLPEEGGRSGKKPSTPLPMEGGCPKGGGWPKAKESEANLRCYAPPPFRGSREKQQKPIYSPFIGKSVGQQVGLGGQIAPGFLSPCVSARENLEIK